MYVAVIKVNYSPQSYSDLFYDDSSNIPIFPTERQSWMD